MAQTPQALDRLASRIFHSLLASSTLTASSVSLAACHTHCSSWPLMLWVPVPSCGQNSGDSYVKSFPMMRRLSDALVLPIVSYGSEVWGPSCSPSLPPDIKKMADVQLAFFRQLCRLKKSVTPAIIFRELSERPWVHRWWSQVIGFMHRLSNMPDGSIHAEFRQGQHC